MRSADQPKIRQGREYKQVGGESIATGDVTKHGEIEIMTRDIICAKRVSMLRWRAARVVDDETHPRCFRVSVFFHRCVQ